MNDNYYEAFAVFARENYTWFEVATDGTLLGITVFSGPRGLREFVEDFSAPCGLVFGTKAAYDWLVGCVESFKKPLDTDE